ncbi:hypothetical protein FM121_14105 [Vagococcus fluvialis bH819]|uniref:Gram-positive cocci surface proteins LPxTG domain-containing protein n=2 Tax=Enterococcaceae TaxID=81852 RepID=A0A1X6WSK8_9ENTE|nr:hypothetical protein FM121_14105 [Vagococcus fluvialis bH819]
MAITGDLSAPQQQAEEEIIDVEEPKEFIQKVKLVEGQRRLPKTNEKSNSWLMSLGCLILLTSLWLVSKIKSATDVTK